MGIVNVDIEPTGPNYLFNVTKTWDTWLAIKTAGSFIIGRQYTIMRTGTTNFVSIGASSNIVGTKFIATGVGTGTGTAQATVESLDSQDQSGATQHLQTNFWPDDPNPNSGTFPRCALVTPGFRGGTSTDLMCQYGPDLTGANQMIAMLTRPAFGMLGNGSISGEYSPLNAAIAFQFWFRISQYHGMAGQAGWKFFEMWTPDGTDRTQLSFLTLDDPIASLCLNYNSTGASGLTPFGNLCNLPLINDNRYHRLTLLLKSQTGTNLDGYTKVWFDGTKVIDISATAIDVIPPGGSNVWCTSTDVSNVTTLGIGDDLRLGETLNGSGGRLDVTFTPIQAWLM
jgi:hypothetical protein